MDYIRRIRDLREDSDYTQEYVAHVLGTSQTMYARYERGANELPIRHLISLCKLYNVSSDYLLGLFIKSTNGYPRISLTVPSIVIMVPGLYLYRAIYNFGIMSLSDAVSWFAAAIMIIIALPLGLIFARILTDKTFRYCT